MFENALDALAAVRNEEKDKLEYTVTDIPKILIEAGSRTLEFVIIVRFTGNKFYMAACRQTITVADGKVTCEFKKTDFKEINDWQNPLIKGQTLTDIINDNGLGPLQ